MEPIYVTQPFMPPLEEFVPYLEKIWARKWLTNNGFFHQEFEKQLCDYLGVKYVSLFSNGTLALITALQTLRITGEVITTPFSFVATTHALWWNGIKPVFADIEPNTFNLDPLKIEAAITPQTTAILPVHVYGNPCNIEAIQKIADIYGLKIIYDACHAFSVKIKDIPICNFGDLSVLSFHATKVFNTFEGGAIICHDEKTHKRIELLKNFGFADEVTVIAPGINAKMNEVQAAFGLLNLKYIDVAINKRHKIIEQYRSNLNGIKGITILTDLDKVQHNYSFFPILINNLEFRISRDEVYTFLKQQNIYTRRYFYPLISDFPTYKGLPSSSPINLSTAKDISEKVLCLPVFPDLAIKMVDFICELLISLKTNKK